MPGWPVGIPLSEAIKKPSDKPTDAPPQKGPLTSLELAKKVIADRAAHITEFDKKNSR